MEIWKDIKGYKNYYQISNLGRVKSLERKILLKNNKIKFYREKILKFCYFNGYPFVELHKNKLRISYRVHRLVAQAFIPNPENKPQVNHKNSIRNDNRVENLEWVTAKENIQHCILNKRFKPNGEDRSFVKEMIEKHAKNIKKCYT